MFRFLIRHLFAARGLGFGGLFGGGGGGFRQGPLFQHQSLSLGLTFQDGGGHTVGHQANGTYRVIVAGDGVSYQVRVGIGVHDGEDGNTHPAGLGDTDILFTDVDDKHCLGQGGHILDAQKILFQLGQGFLQLQPFLFGQHPEIALIALLLQLNHVVDAAADGLEIG